MLDEMLMSSLMFLPIDILKPLDLHGDELIAVIVPWSLSQVSQAVHPTSVPFHLHAFDICPRAGSEPFYTIAEQGDTGDTIQAALQHRQFSTNIKALSFYSYAHHPVKG